MHEGISKTAVLMQQRGEGVGGSIMAKRMSGVLTGLCLYMHTWVRFVFLFQTDIKSHNMSVWVVFLSWCNLLPP